MLFVVNTKIPKVKQLEEMQLHGFQFQADAQYANRSKKSREWSFTYEW